MGLALRSVIRAGYDAVARTPENSRHWQWADHRDADAALNPEQIKIPDFKVATTKYKVEDKAKWRLGDTTDVTYDGRGE